MVRPLAAASTHRRILSPSAVVAPSRKCVAAAAASARGACPLTVQPSPDRTALKLPSASAETRPTTMAWPECNFVRSSAPFLFSDWDRRWADSTADVQGKLPIPRSEEHTSELQSLMRISYAVFCLKKKKK